MTAFRPEDHPRKLNLGCGFDHKPGYLNVDFRDFHEPDLVADVCDLHDLPDARYDEVLAQDVLEHLPRSRTREALAEWNRVLAPGGILQMRTTSLLGLLELFRRREFRSVERHEELMQCLFGTQAYEGDFHYTCFTELLLRHYLEEAGFHVESLGTRDEWLFDVQAKKVRDVPSRRDPVAALLAVGRDDEFLARAYETILGRPPDAEGFAYYHDRLQRRAVRRDEVVRILGASEEGRRRAAAVQSS